MQNYQLTIFMVGGKRVERKIVAPSRAKALITALNTLPADEVPACLICKTHREAQTERIAK